MTYDCDRYLNLKKPMTVLNETMYFVKSDGFLYFYFQNKIDIDILDMILVYDTVLCDTEFCDTVFCDTVLCDTCMWYFYVILYFRGYLSLWASSDINDVTTLNRFLMMIGWLCFCLYFQVYFCFEKKSILFCLKLFLATIQGVGDCHNEGVLSQYATTIYKRSKR